MASWTRRWKRPVTSASAWDTQAIRRSRESIPQPSVDTAANAGEKGAVIQLQRVRGAGERRHGEGAGRAEIIESGRLQQQQRSSER
jgi:hypothetical protein